MTVKKEVACKRPECKEEVDTMMPEPVTEQKTVGIGDVVTWVFNALAEVKADTIEVLKDYRFQDDLWVILGFRRTHLSWKTDIMPMIERLNCKDVELGAEDDDLTLALQIQ